MGITYGDYLIYSGYHDITPEQEREIEAREECARRGLDPDDDAADGVQVWMVVDQEMRQSIRPVSVCQQCGCSFDGDVELGSCDDHFKPSGHSLAVSSTECKGATDG